MSSDLPRKIRPRIAGLAALALLVVLLAAGAAWLAREQTLRDMAALLTRQTQGQVVFDGVSGSLLHVIHIERVTWRTDRADWVLDDVTGHWSPQWVLLATAAFHDVAIGHAEIRQKPAATAASDNTGSWRLRMRLRFLRTGVETLVWQHESDTREFHRLAFDVNLGWRTWSAGVTGATTPWGALTGDVRTDPRPPHALTGSLALRRTGDAPLALDVRAEGDVAHIAMKATLQARDSRGEGTAVLEPNAVPPIQHMDLTLQAVNPDDLIPGAPAALIDGSLHAASDGAGFRGQLAFVNRAFGTLDSGRLPIAAIDATIAADQSGTWQLNGLQLDLGPAGKLRGDGRVNDHEVGLNVQGEALDLRGLHGKMHPTRLQLALAATGDLHAQHLQLDLRQPGYRAVLAASVSGQSVTLEHATATIGGGTLQASGHLDFDVPHEFALLAAVDRFDVSRVGQFRPSRITGRLSANGSFDRVLRMQGEATLSSGSMLFELPAQGHVVWRSRGVDDPRIRLNSNAVIGQTHITIDGRVIDPQDLKSLDMNMSLEGHDLAQLYTIARLPMPPTGDYRVAGRLRYDDRVWSFEQFTGAISRSDIAGTLSVDRRGTRMLVRGDLTSERLDVRDLSGFVGEQDAVKQPGRVLPHTEYRLDKLNAADADVRFTGRRIRNERLPLNRMSAHVVLRDGILTLDPLDFGAAGGTIHAQIKLDARNAPIRADADIRGQHLALNRLAPDVKAMLENSGTIDARIKLAMQGNSPAALLASAEGDVVAVMNGGGVSDLALRLANLDLANALLVMARGDREIPVRCMVANFAARDGVLQPRVLLLDTEHTVIAGNGNVNLDSEQLDLQLNAQPKDGSLFALRGPIKVDGTFAAPDVHPQLGNVLLRTGVAVALGAVAGPAALVPFLQAGQDQQIDCAPHVNAAAQFVRAST